MNDTDLELVTHYARHHAEDAFAEIVRRHLNLVFSTALRQVRSPQLAEEVAQSVFIDLARQASRLAPDTVLSAWLYQVTRHTAIDVVRREARRQHREQIANELTAMSETTMDWTQIEPLLDEAMHALAEAERTAVLLRYFENKSFLEVGQTLGTTEDAARKRISRAVERMREFLARRGVAVGATALVAVVSTNAVQAAPPGLAATISSAAVLAGTAVATTTATATLTKAIAMTTLHKTLITVALVATAGTGIYEARQVSTLRDQVQTLQQQQAPLTAQLHQSQRERDDATNQLAGLLADHEQLKSNPNEAELLKLHDEVGMLRQQADELRQQAQSRQDGEKQKSPTFSTNVVLRESWKFAGYATPEAAVQSLAWAKSVGDVQTFLGSVDPEQTNAVVKSYLNKLSQTSEEEQSKRLFDESKTVAGLQILNQFPLADDKVLMQVSFQVQASNGTFQQGDAMMVFKRVDGEWKYLNEYLSPGFRRLPSN